MNILITSWLLTVLILSNCNSFVVLFICKKAHTQAEQRTLSFWHAWNYPVTHGKVAPPNGNISKLIQSNDEKLTKDETFQKLETNHLKQRNYATIQSEIINKFKKLKIKLLAHQTPSICWPEK